MNTRPIILAADNNAVERNLIEARLGLLDCDARVFADAESAIKALDGSTEFSLVLTDVRLGATSGLDILRHIRRLEGERARLPVVAVTAMAMKGDRERLLDAGMDGYLGKPYRQTAFEAVIARFVGIRYRTGRRVAPPRDSMTVATPRRVAAGR